MEEKLVSYPVAKLAKECGFDWPTPDYFGIYLGKLNKYTSQAEEFDSDRTVTTNWNDGRGSYPTLPEDVDCSAPTQSLLQKWLRDVKFIHIPITTVSQHSWQCYITEPGEYMEESNMYDSFMSYEDALEGGLLRALLHIKESIS